MKAYCVYCHTNKTDGKKYIGITCNKPEIRWGKGRGYVNNRYFSRAISKYGWDGFDHEILYTELTKEQAEEIEIRLIKEHSTTDPACGYNIEQGGNSFDKFTDEIRAKISQSLKGHYVSEETKEKIRASKIGQPSGQKGYKRTPEQIERNRLSHMGIPAWNKGKVWSKEERAKFGGKPVKCVELDKVFRSAHEASEELNIAVSSICGCRRGLRKTAGGYHFVNAEEFQPTNG